MPELPEVESVKTALQNNYLNKTIKSVDVFYPKILANISVDDFKNNLINQKIISLNRKGKFLIINLSNCNLIIHLRMEGKFKYNKENFDKHSHIVFYFNDDSLLIYHDVRKFGKIYYFEKNLDIYQIEPLNKLGPDANLDIDINYFLAKIQNSNDHIKSILLNQSILAGIGNIYADEILFFAKVNPFKKGKEITFNEASLILKGANNILNKAILYKGSTIKSFQSEHGVNGNYQMFLKVYGKANSKCPNCNTLIIKDKINGRGTNYCPFCQK